MDSISKITDINKYLDGITFVIFDLDDTLYSEKDYVKSGFCSVEKAFPQLPKGVLWEAFEKKEPAIDYVFNKYDLSSKKEEALGIYRKHTPEIELYPGVEELLKDLKIKKGIITDGRPNGQRAKIEALGLDALIDEIIITDELGGTEYRKPNPKAFEMMQEKAGVPFEEMLYVGDNPKKDFIAPEKLGMHYVFFKNPDGLYSRD